MQRAYKFRIYPDTTQKILIEKTFGCTRLLYNHFLDQRIKMYEADKKSTTYNTQAKEIPLMKNELEFLKEVDSTALQSTVKNLHQAFVNFHRESKKHGYKLKDRILKKLSNGTLKRQTRATDMEGHPQFKSKKNPCKSYTTKFTNNNIQIFEDSVKLPKLGMMKCKVHRSVHGRIMSSTVSRVADIYYVSVLVDADKPKNLDKVDSQIGVDLGLTHFCITSEGVKYGNPKFLGKNLKKLKKLQRKLSRQVPGSSNRYKTQMKIAKLHHRISNQRKDFLHKLSTKLINENQVIVLESLKVKKMMQDGDYSRGISDVGWSRFVEYLEYKAQWYGREIKKIGTWFPSTKMCSKCSFLMPKLPVSVRQWTCPQCHEHHDRDINASINILNAGI